MKVALVVLLSLTALALSSPATSERQEVGLGAGRKLLAEEDTRVYNTVNKKNSGKNFDMTSNGSYFKFLEKKALPGFVIAGLSIAAAIGFVIGRYGLNKCGGKKLPKGGYTRRQRQILFATNAAVTTVFLLGTIIGIANSVRLTNSAKRFITTMDTGLVSQVNEVDVIISQIKDTAIISNTSLVTGTVPSIDDLTASAQAAVDHLNVQTRPQILNFDRIRSIAVAFGLLVCVMAGVSGLLSAMLRRGVLSTIMFLLGSLAALIVWLSVGVHLPVSTAVADFCYSIQEFQPTYGNVMAAPNSKAGVAYVAECLPATNVQSAVTITSQSLFNEAAALAIENRGKLYPDIAYNVSNPFAGFNPTTGKFEALEQAIAEIRPRLTTSKEKEIFGRITSIVRLLGPVRRLAYCTTIVNLYVAAEGPLCITSLDSLDVIIIISIIVGCTLLAAVISAILGMKRFKKLSEDLKLNADVDGDRARNAFANAEDQDEIELKNKKEGAKLSADKWNRL